MHRFVAACLVVAALAGCGGGEGPQANGGIGGSGISNGAVTGFGSIFVTGTEYDVSDAQISFERQNGNASDLRLGMVVVVEGDRDAGGSTGTARRVTFDDEIEGPISALTVVSLDVLEATILGQTVRIERGLTVFDDTPPLTFDTLAVNDRVEVSGFRQDEGRILATFVEKLGVFTPGSTPRVELKGTVSGRAGTTFAIGSVIVTFDGSTQLSDLPGSGPENGDFVEVEGTLTAPDAVFASRIEREGAETGDIEDFELEGLVTDFVSLASFRVADQPVDASGAGVVFEPNDPGFVANGARVEVEGELQAGVLVAVRVKLRGGEVRVAAEVASAGDVNPGAGTLELLGIVIRIDAQTLLKDDEGGDGDLELADIAAGDFLEVRGIEDGAGSILATEIVREETDAVELRGRVEAIDAVGPDRSVTILGVVVPTDAGTQFEGFPVDVSDEDAFYAFVQLGDLLGVEDEQDGNESAIDVADDIEFEDEDE